MTAALVDRLRALPAADRARILGELSWREKAMLGHLWSFWLRPDEREPGAVKGTGQMPPATNWIFWVAQGARGAGKSTCVGAWFDDEAERLGTGFAGAILVATDEEGRKLIEDERSGFEKHIATPGRVTWEPSKKLLTWKNGARAWVISTDEGQKARAGNFNRVWIDDPPKFAAGAHKFVHTFLRALRVEGYGLRVGIATTPPDPNDPPRCPELLEWMLDQQEKPQPDGAWVFSYVGSSKDNLQNLDADYARVLEQLGGTGNEEAEEEGIYNKDGGPRIFREVRFPDHRALVLPDHFDEVVVSIDPAKSSNTHSCEVGIVVGGVRLDMARAFLLEDASGHFNSDQWPQRAWDAAERWITRARRWHFVIEDNTGRVNMSLLTSEERTRCAQRNPGVIATSRCEIRPVTSRQAKGERARPLPGIYRAGQIGHAPGLERVEGQMHRLTEAERQQIKLDRADAAVYALLDLFGHLAGQEATALGVSSVQAGAFGRAPMSAINVGAAQAPQAQPTQAAAFTFAMPGGVGRGTFT